MPLDTRLISHPAEGRLRPVSSRGLRRAAQPTPTTTSCNCEFPAGGDPVGVDSVVRVPAVIHSLDRAVDGSRARDSRSNEDNGPDIVMSRSTIPHNLWTQCAQRCEQFALRAIEWYQVQRQGAVSPCRFFPSCSEYSHQAISTHGVRRGMWLTVRRLSRCRPFGPSGFDPVPEPRPSDRALGHAKEHRHV